MKNGMIIPARNNLLQSFDIKRGLIGFRTLESIGNTLILSDQLKRMESLEKLNITARLAEKDGNAIVSALLSSRNQLKEL